MLIFEDTQPSDQCCMKQFILTDPPCPRLTSKPLRGRGKIILSYKPNVSSLLIISIFRKPNDKQIMPNRGVSDCLIRSASASCISEACTRGWMISPVD